jgi:hypothetical protein
MHTVWIVWTFRHGYSDVKEYRFETEAELNAFVRGVIEADPEGERHAFCDSEADAEAYLEETESEED